MQTSMWVGFLVILFVSIAFLGPGLFSDRTDYPLVNWVRRQLGRRRTPAPAEATVDTAADPGKDEGTP